MSEQTSKHGPELDDYLRQQTREGAGHVEEFHQVEPAAVDDEPDRTGRRPDLGGTRQEAVDLRSRIAAAVGRHAFPGDRAALLRVAGEHSADDEVLDVLARLPHDQVFENVQAASRALGLAVEPPDSPR